MDLSSFSSVFEVAVGLNLAFVAAEYANSYTNLLAKYVYKLYDRIGLLFDECARIVNQSAVEDLEGNVVDGKNTYSSVEEIKIEYAGKKKDLDGKKSEILRSVDERCHFRCFAFISLYLSLYSLTALFVSGFSDCGFLKSFWLVFFVVSLIYMLGYSLFVGAGWCKKATASLNVCMISFFLVTVVSTIATSVLSYFGILSQDWFVTCVRHGVWLSAIIPYVNFVIFVFIMRSRSKELFTEAVGIVDKMKPEWENMKRVVSDLGAVNRVSADLKNKAPSKPKAIRPKKGDKT